MKPEIQRIKIAEACGWTEISPRMCWGLPPGAEDDGTENCLRSIPHYLNDLNAIHKAEKILSEDHQKSYRGWLVVVCNGNHWNAAATQRAEAFLRTLDLWETDTP